MKTRVTLTLDSAILQQAKNMARDRKISLSGLVENLLNHSQGQSHKSNQEISFSSKWAGKFELRKTQNDPLLDAIKAQYNLE